MGKREQIMEIARQQLGYKEGPNNDTKFGAWYGLPNQPWCAMFVSWCAEQAELNELIPKFAYVPTGVQWFRQRGLWAGRSAVPRRGDVVFFGNADHVGLVESAAGGLLATIEGNTSPGGNSANGDGVYRRTRALCDSWIMGYGLPAYEEDEQMTYEQFKTYMEQYLTELGQQPPAAWSASARAWSEQSGLIVGNQEGDKKYRQWCTREQMVVFMQRLYQMLKS